MPDRGGRNRAKAPSHVVGFDDAPFAPAHRGDVLVVGAVYAGSRLTGVMSGKVRRDGSNATRVLTRLVTGSRFAPQLQAVLLQGVALAGFNVVDLPRLHTATGLPVIAVSRRRPNLPTIRDALLKHVSGGPRKWRLIETLEPMRAAAGLYVQAVGISVEDAERLIDAFAVNGRMPEPLRTAHLVAAGVGTGESRHRA